MRNRLGGLHPLLILNTDLIRSEMPHVPQRSNGKLLASYFVRTGKTRSGFRFTSRAGGLSLRTFHDMILASISSSSVHERRKFITHTVSKTPSFVVMPPQISVCDS